MERIGWPAGGGICANIFEMIKKKVKVNARACENKY